MPEHGSARTPYEVLGVAVDADQATVRRAYLALARRFHPDAHADRSPAERSHAERRMREVNEAWAALSDPARRRAYDEEHAPGTAGARSRPRPQGKGWTPRADDDAWMDDFESWRAETDVLPPDRPGPRRPVRVLPAAILAAGGAVGLLGMVLTSRPLFAVAFALVLMSLALWIWLPMAELARSRAADPEGGPGPHRPS